MMPKNIVLLAAILASIACQPGKRFPNKDKWILLPALDRRPLHGHPREVIEYSIVEADTARPEKWREFYFRYRFNADGDMVNRASYLSGTLQITDEYQYDANGVQVKSTDVKRGEFSRIVSRAQGNYSYRSISTRRDGTAAGSMDSFPPGGWDQIEKQYQDTAMTGTPFFEAHLYFDGDTMTRAVYHSNGGVITEWRYFYSRSVVPDSIQVWVDAGSGANLFRREINFNNDYGDPLRHLMLQGEDTLDDSEYKYVYDRNGNWTRRIGVDVKANPRNPSPGQRFATQREYIY
jgi:hypothetical protein